MSHRTSPGPPTPCQFPRRHNSAYTFTAGWKEQVSLHPSSPPSTGEPLRACWPDASLSGTGTVVQQTARPSSGQWTPSVPLSSSSWIFSLHDAPAKPIVSWRTPPIPPTVSSSSYHQEDGTRASEPAPPDCSTAFSPRLWEPWTQNHPAPLWNPIQTPTSWNMDSPPPPQPYHVTGKKLSNFFVQFKVCYTQVSVQTTCSNTLSSIRTRHFHTLLCVHKSHKRLSDICMFTCSCTTNHLTLFPSQLLECFSFCTCTVFARHFHSLYFFCLCIGNHFYI